MVLTERNGLVVNERGWKLLRALFKVTEPDADLSWLTERKGKIDMELVGKVALVTGGSSGIGKAIAKRFASEGAEVCVLASSSLEKANAVVQEIQALGAVAHPMVCDARSVTEIKRTVAAVIAKFGRVDILVNSAGHFIKTVPGRISEEDYDLMADVNLKSSVFFINEVVPHMSKQEGGKIINISSAAAVIGIQPYAVYCAVKAGLSMLTRAMASDLAPLGININAICPGNTETPMNDAVRNDPSYREILASMEESTPSLRKFTPPDEIAELAVYLASNRSRAMHGASLVIDEGISVSI
jgi:NAD(P)-dependent dehydrogenase (short-subunit alcohol dehydrogenase family)